MSQDLKTRLGGVLVLILGPLHQAQAAAPTVHYSPKAMAPACLVFGPIVIESRGHGRSTRDARPYAYTRMASDVRAVMDALHIDRAAFIGWSDGACVALTLAMQTAARATGVFFFGCNMDPTGAKPFLPTPVIDRCFERHRKDYTAL